MPAEKAQYHCALCVLNFHSVDGYSLHMKQVCVLQSVPTDQLGEALNSRLFTHASTGPKPSTNVTNSI